MKTLKTLLLSTLAIVLLTACTATSKDGDLTIITNPSEEDLAGIDELTTISIGFSEEFTTGSDAGYEDGLANNQEALAEYLPLRDEYTQFELGYIDGFYAGCNEEKHDCTDVNAATEAILAGQEEGKYDVETTRKES
jgi:hypothetical protein